MTARCVVPGYDGLEPSGGVPVVGDGTKNHGGAS